MLTGQELLATIKSMGDAPRADVARACGYVTTKKDGSERINFTAFYEAIVDAKGVTLAPPIKAAGPKRGKALSFRAKVSKTGTIPITAGYSSLLGVSEGDYVTIEYVDGGLMLRAEAASTEAKAPAAAACEAPTPVVVTPVTTYDSAPVPAERELVGAGAERTPF